MKRLRIPGEKTLHGLRPTVTTKLHAAGVDGETRRELLGHSGKDVHETVYLRLSVKTLSESLEKLRYKF
jgi:integrase